MKSSSTAISLRQASRVETIVLSLARGLAEVRNEKGLAEFDVLWRHKPGGESTTTVRSHFACSRARASLSSWNRPESDVVHVAGRPSRHSYLVIFA